MKIYQDYVDLTIGRVYFKPLKNGLVNKALVRSTIIHSTLNNALYLHIIEEGLVRLSRRKVSRLSVRDGDKLRNKTKEILKRHGLIDDEEEREVEEEEQKADFSDEEIKWFDKAKEDALSRMKVDKGAKK